MEKNNWKYDPKDFKKVKCEICKGKTKGCTSCDNDDNGCLYVYKKNNFIVTGSFLKLCIKNYEEPEPIEF